MMCAYEMRCYENWPLGLDAGLGGAALALGAHRAVFLYLTSSPASSPFFRFVILVTVHLYDPL
jgi:hypothetical protein